VAVWVEQTGRGTKWRIHLYQDIIICDGRLAKLTTTTTAQESKSMQRTENICIESKSRIIRVKAVHEVYQVCSLPSVYMRLFVFSKSRKQTGKIKQTEQTVMIR
jgi:hypothetical protein